MSLGWTSLRSPSLDVPSGGDGFPNFVSLEARHRCPVCNMVLKQPLQTLCGHRICQQCIIQWFSTHGEPSRCPVGDDACEMLGNNNNTMFPDQFAAREIRQLSVYCPHHLYGCKKEMPWSDLKDHVMKFCEFVPEKCPFSSRGCTKMLVKAQMTSHVTQECLFRNVACPHCDEHLPFNKLEVHIQQDCLQSLMPCPYGCGEQALQRNKVKLHQETCSARPCDCRYKTMGCTVQGSVHQIKAHEKESLSQHLELVTMMVAKQDLVIMETKRKTKDLTEENSILRKQVTAYSGEMGSKDQQITILKKQLNDLQEKQKSYEQEIAQMRLQLNGLQSDINHTNSNIAAVNRRQSEMAATIDNGLLVTGRDDHSMDSLQRQITDLSLSLAECNQKLQAVPLISYDGQLLWRIDSYSKRKQDAVTGMAPSVCSPPFYTSRNGYKMCARAYLNGDGQGHNTHLSLFFVIMKGEYDNILSWPFKQKVTFLLLDQEERVQHLRDQFRPDPISSSFQKPVNEMNIATGCPLFVSQSKIDAPNSRYLKDETLFLRVVVDVSNLTI